MTSSGAENRSLEGDILSLASRQGRAGGGSTVDGTVAAGLLFDGSAAPQLFALTLDEDLCVVAAWRRPLDPADATVDTLLALPDGGMALGGWVPGSGRPDDRDVWISRRASDGEPLWQLIESDFLYVNEELNTPSRESVQALALRPGLELIAAGSADINEVLHSNWILVLDDEGHISRRIDLPRDDPRTPGEIITLLPGSDGSLWLAGSLYPLDTKADPWLLVLGPHQNFLWDRRYVEPGWQNLAGATLLERQNGDALVMVGRKGDSLTGDGWIAAVDARGSPLWSAIVKQQGAAVESFAAVVALESHIVAGGEFERDGEKPQTWLAFFNADGQQTEVLAPVAGNIRTLQTLGEDRILAGGSDGDGRPMLFLTSIEARQ